MLWLLECGFTHRFLQTDSQVNHWHVGCGDTEGHAGQLAVKCGHKITAHKLYSTGFVVCHSLGKGQPVDSKIYAVINVMCFWCWPVEFGDDLPNSLGSPSGSRDDVLASTTSVPPQLSRGTVHCLLGGSDGVNCALSDKDEEEDDGKVQMDRKWLNITPPKLGVMLLFLVL